MKFLKLTFFLIFLQCFSFGQTKEIAVVNQEVIKKNKIYKCLEYDFQDSLSFFKNYKSAYYTIFDTQGRKIEENAYSSVYIHSDSLETINEFQVIYSYDKFGHQYMWHWYQENSSPKITRTRIEKYDSTGKNIGYCEYRPNSNETCDSYETNSNVTDTITTEFKSSKQRIIRTFSAQSQKDTIYLNYYFYKKEQLDSNILIHFEKGKLLEKLITKYYYLGGVLSKTELVRFYDGQISETNSTSYVKNGLLDKIESFQYYFTTKKSTPRIDKDYRKFIYTYWK